MIDRYDIRPQGNEQDGKACSQLPLPRRFSCYQRGDRSGMLRTQPPPGPHPLGPPTSLSAAGLSRPTYGGGERGGEGTRPSSGRFRTAPGGLGASSRRPSAAPSLPCAGAGGVAVARNASVIPARLQSSTRPNSRSVRTHRAPIAPRRPSWCGGRVLRVLRAGRAADWGRPTAVPLGSREALLASLSPRPGKGGSILGSR